MGEIVFPELHGVEQQCELVDLDDHRLELGPEITMRAKNRSPELDVHAREGEDTGRPGEQRGIDS